MISLIFCFKQKTAYEMRISDWSSDVCSSDLELAAEAQVPPYIVVADAVLREMVALKPTSLAQMSNISGVGAKKLDAYGDAFLRSEERRVGKACVSTCRSRWASNH